MDCIRWSVHDLILVDAGVGIYVLIVEDLRVDAELENETGLPPCGM
jgi:hypothetical protein